MLSSMVTWSEKLSGKAGFRLFGGDPGSHTVVENNLKQAESRLRMVLANLIISIPLVGSTLQRQ